MTKLEWRCRKRPLVEVFLVKSLAQICKSAKNEQWVYTPKNSCERFGATPGIARGIANPHMRTQNIKLELGNLDLDMALFRPVRIRFSVEIWTKSKLPISVQSNSKVWIWIGQRTGFATSGPGRPSFGLGPIFCQQWRRYSGRSKLL